MRTHATPVRRGATGRRVVRWLLAGALVTGAVALTGAAATAVVLATSGVFDHRAGAWTVPVRLAPGVRVEANGSGLLRLATSPLGLRVLDGQSTTTALGTLRFSRDGDALLVRCAPCRLNDARVAPRMLALPPTELRLTRRAGVESNNVLDAVLSVQVNLPTSAQTREESSELVSAQASAAASEPSTSKENRHANAQANLPTRRAPVEATATLTLAPTGVQVQWSLPATPLAQLLRVLGDGLPELRAAQVSGTVQGDGTLSLPALRPHTRLQFAEVAVAGLGTEQLAGGSISFQCRDASGAARQVQTGESEKQWLAPEALGTWLPAAVLAAQDARFHEHTGFEASALARTLSGQAAGAGTLTQQLARTLYTGRDGTLVAQLRELLYATEMEQTLGKERILALHLNTVAWGPGACGARAAARLYFGKRAAQLTPLEAAWLGGILQDPDRAYQQQVLGGLVDHERTQWVLLQLRELPKAEREKWRRQRVAFSARARPALVIAGTGTSTAP
jgi:hypothetical protein